MITPMKKYTVLVYHKEYEEFLTLLGKLGVLHIGELSKERNDEILSEKTVQLSRYDHVLGILKKTEPDPAPASDINKYNQEEILSHIEDLIVRKNKVEEELVEIQGEIDRIIPWGDFDQGDFDRLKSAGYKIQLYRCPVMQFDPEWEEKFQLFVINKVKGVLYFIIVATAEEDILIDAETEKLSSSTLSFLRNELENAGNNHKEILTELSSLTSYAPVILEKKRQSLVDEISMISAILNTKKVSEDKLMILEGWSPEEKENKLANLLNERGIVHFESSPDKNDSPPVLLKNSRFST